jgi:hypothetical protein
LDSRFSCGSRVLEIDEVLLLPEDDEIVTFEDEDLELVTESFSLCRGDFELRDFVLVCKSVGDFEDLVAFVRGDELVFDDGEAAYGNNITQHNTINNVNINCFGCSETMKQMNEPAQRQRQDLD